jgi:hypothetical protein
MINIPTLSELYNSIKADIEAELGVIIPSFGPSLIRVKATVLAAQLKLFYLAVGLLQKNIFVDTADPESIGGTLERFGRVKLGRNPFAAVQGQYVVSVTGTAGAVINAFTTFKSDDSALNVAKIFQLDEEYTLTGSNDQITIRALEAGIGSKLQDGDTLTSTAPIALVDSVVEVSSEVVQPLAAEDIEEYRAKAIQAYQLEPQGGAASDYIIWSADAQGVRKSYPYARDGASNEINLFIEANEDDSTDGRGTPGTAILDEVEEVVEFDPDTTKPLTERGRRPLGVFKIHFLPITVKLIDIEIVDYQGLTPAIEAQLETAIQTAFKDIRPFVAGADVLANKNDILNVIKIAFIIQDALPQSVYDSLSFMVDGTEFSTFVFQDGDIPWLNSITYV